MTRNDLIEILVDVLKDSKYDSSIFDTAYRAVNAIGDVQPVIHGKWKGIRCSVCNGKQLKSQDEYDDDACFEDSNYCPSCGAKMDLK